MEELNDPALIALFDKLAQSDWGVAPDLFPRELCRELRSELLQARLFSGFRQAGVGRAIEHRVVHEVRNDQVMWLDREAAPLGSAQARFLDLIEQLRVRLARELFVALRGFESHFSIYPAGSFYARHLDQFKGSPAPGMAARHISFVLYLNPAGWSESDGGQLRLFAADGKTFTDVVPAFGTVVCFSSARVYHEVLPTKRERLSLAGWFFS